MQFKQAIHDIDTTTLSPNLAEINKHLKKTKDMLDLRNDDGKGASTLSVELSPKRLQIQSPERFENSNAFDQTMPHLNDRYNFAKSARNRDGKKHPPRLSPRGSMRSVDPLERLANQSFTSPMKSTAGFGPTILNAFTSKKQSLQIQS